MNTKDWRMGHYPTPARVPNTDQDLIDEARLFNHHDIAERLVTLLGLCKCNVGVQTCPAHPGKVRLKTKEEKITFRKEWDRSTVESYRGTM